MKKILLISFGFFALTGCSELEPFLPKVKFDKLSVRNISFQEANVDFVFTIDNPNPVSVNLASFSYALGFEEIQLLSGDNADGFSLAASGGSDLSLPVDLVFADAWNTVQATRGEDEIDFGLDGKFGFNIPELGEVKVPYNAGGAFPALRTPKISLQALRATNVNFLTQTAALELDLGIDNEHASTLFFSGLDYDIKLGGDSVATGIIADLAEVSGAESETVILPINVNLLTAGVTLVNAITGNGDLNVQLAATVDVLTPFLDTSIPLSISEDGNLTVGQ
jgi:LEA14-like dessication related protein